jgi:hypothetical protein
MEESKKKNIKLIVMVFSATATTLGAVFGGVVAIRGCEGDANGNSVDAAVSTISGDAASLPDSQRPDGKFTCKGDYFSQGNPIPTMFLAFARLRLGRTIANVGTWCLPESNANPPLDVSNFLRAGPFRKIICHTQKSDNDKIVRRLDFCVRDGCPYRECIIESAKRAFTLNDTPSPKLVWTFGNYRVRVIGNCFSASLIR